MGLDLAASAPLRDGLRFLHWAEGALLTPTPVSGWVAAGFAVQLPDASLEEAVMRCEPDKHDAMAWVPVATVMVAIEALKQQHQTSGDGGGVDVGAGTNSAVPSVEDLVGHLNGFTAKSLLCVVNPTYTSPCASP